MSFSFSVLPVYSEQHPDPKYQFGPIRLLKHQVETLEAFGDDDIDVIINTAMTGDGKSLAAYLPALKDGKCILAMYPTNELIQDQYDALPKYERRPQLVLPKRELMYSGRITKLAHEHGKEVRMETVRGLLKYDVLLTNPDLIHLMMSHQYGWGHLLKELPAMIGANFDYLLFDEFHVFDVPQVIAVMNILGYLLVNYRDKPNERRKFVFLSATPSRLMENMLNRGEYGTGALKVAIFQRREMATCAFSNHVRWNCMAQARSRQRKHGLRSALRISIRFSNSTQAQRPLFWSIRWRRRNGW